MSIGMAHNDLDRFGAGSFTVSPRQANVMIVSGTVSTKMAERMTWLYEQMPEPKWGIAMVPAPSQATPVPAIRTQEN
jgi:NADH-quinone oxidoreductase subunit B